MQCPVCNKKVKTTHFHCVTAGIAGKATGKCKARDPDKMKQAANKRWEKYRKQKGKE